MEPEEQMSEWRQVGKTQQATAGSKTSWSLQAFGKEPRPADSFNPVTPVLGFWPTELYHNKCVLFSANKGVQQ